MSSISRRELLASGLVLTASSLAARSAWAGAVRLFADPLQLAPEGAIAPREQLLFDFGWKFLFGHATDPLRDLGFGMNHGVDHFGDFAKTGDFDFSKASFDDSGWRSLNLPHDWAVELPYVDDEEQRFAGYKPLGKRYPETSIGWYRRVFDIPATDQGKRMVVAFDGAFRDALVFVNGCLVGRNESGYNSFCFDITDFLSYGAKNCIAVRVDATFSEGWFYEGAGIYRHVWLIKTDALHLGSWESTVRSEVSGSSATLTLGTVIENEGKQMEHAAVSWRIVDGAGKTVATATCPAQSIPMSGSASFTASAKLAAPALWSVETPNLYSAIVAIESGGKVRDAERVSFGIRTAVFDANKGFLLNGKAVKLQGTCNHQDHAGVGVALPDRLQTFRLGVLRDFGCNAVRTAHNMPTPEFVDGCDRMGVMMMCETRQMSASPEALAQLDVMVKRYRNSPSIVMWSIGNEEREMQKEEAAQGVMIGTTMVQRCHQLDPTRVVSAAVNDHNEMGVSDALDIVGFNYGLPFPDVFHKKYPKRPIYGSETGGGMSTRGEYTTDPLRHTEDSFDNMPAAYSWSSTAEGWWTYYATREWAAGGFVWTGFDYRGEPVPYQWPSIGTVLGAVDLCGFFKDTAYYYKAWWRSEPALHLFPHWNFAGREGELMPVRVYSNLDEVELFVNGQSQGSQKVPHLGHVQWQVKYQAGAIEARGSKGGKVVLTEKRETTGPAAAIRLTADRMEINADGEDLAILTVEVLDRQGRHVPTADHRIGFRISGAGTLLGVGNGNPTCLESDKEPRRSLFNGLAQVILQSTRSPGEIHVEAVKEGPDGVELVPAKLVIATRKVNLRPAVG
jgi:beta-galactosidase